MCSCVYVCVCVHTTTRVPSWVFVWCVYVYCTRIRMVFCTVHSRKMDDGARMDGWMDDVGATEFDDERDARREMRAMRGAMRRRSTVDAVMRCVRGATRRDVDAVGSIHPRARKEG